MVIQTNIFIMPVIHSKAVWYYAQTVKAKTLVQMSGMGIVDYYGIKLEDLKAIFFCLYQAILNKLFSYMQSSEIRTDGIACVTYMTASADIIGVEYI